MRLVQKLLDKQILPIFLVKAIGLTLFLFLGEVGCVFPAFSAEEKIQKLDFSEIHERNVDKVAAASQESAIQKLQALLKKYRGRPQEATLLAKLADLQQQYAAILFRIAHAPQKKNGRMVPADLSRYTHSLNASVSTLNELIKKFPNHEEIPNAYFLRGKAYEEIGKKQSAASDYLYLTQAFPDFENITAAYMSLAQYAIDENDHPRAIRFLNEIEKRPDDPRYPFALYKLGWSHYNLKDIPKALSFLERHVQYFAEKNENADLAFRENSFLDIPLFYFQGYEDKITNYSVEEALPYFKKIEPTGKTLGKMCLKFARLLRSHDHESDLNVWKSQILKKEYRLPESLDILLVAYEYQQNKKRFASLAESAKDIVKLYELMPVEEPRFSQQQKYEIFQKAQKQLLETADLIQKILIKNKTITVRESEQKQEHSAEAQSELKSLSASLAVIYDSFTKIVNEKDPRVPKVHYNLAETLFAIKDFSGATEHYRWIVERSQASKEEEKADAALKAISSRYEVLLGKKIVGNEVKAKSYKEDQEAHLDPLLAEWVQWVDEYVRRHSNKKKIIATDKVEGFVFELNRAFYFHGRLKEASERMLEFASKFPKSKYAIPSAALVLDSWIETQDWEKLHTLAHDLLKEKAWKANDFYARLNAVAADAFYKLMELEFERKEYSSLLVDAEKFLSRYSKSKRLADALGLAANSALFSGDLELARGYFGRLIQEAPGTVQGANAYFERGKLEEERDEFRAAVEDYRAFLGTSRAKDLKSPDDLRKKILLFSWLTADVGVLQATLQTASVCGPALTSISEECEKYQIILNIEKSAGKTNHDSEKTTLDALERTHHTSGENRTLWAALALEGMKHLGFRDRLYLLRQVASGWDDTDPLVKYFLLPKLSLTIPKTFEKNRLSMKEVAPLRATEKHITRRVEAIREMENAAAKVVKLPWGRIRAEVLNEVALLYIDLSKELSKLPPPKNIEASELKIYEETISKLVMPFDEKGQELRFKAFEMASRFYIEDDSFKRIADAFFADNPSQAKQLKPSILFSPAAEIDLNFYQKIFDDDRWNQLSEIKFLEKVPQWKKDSQARRRWMWVQAIHQKQWVLISYFLQGGEEKLGISKQQMPLIRAIALNLAGARGEALAQVEQIRQDLDAEKKIYVSFVMLRYAINACAKDRVRELIKELPADLKLSEEDSFFLFSAGNYVGIAPKTAQ